MKPVPCTPPLFLQTSHCIGGRAGKSLGAIDNMADTDDTSSLVLCFGTSQLKLMPPCRCA